MASARIFLLSLVAMLAGVAWVRAHYNMLLPETATCKKGVPMNLIYQWGHPFEHQLFDAPGPRVLSVYGPDTKATDLTRNLEKVTSGSDTRGATSYRLRFTPEQRGDYTFVLKTPPIWMAEDQEFLQDTVQVVVHVQAQRGWDCDTGQRFKFVPLTRPYGLQSGTVFQAQVRSPAPLAGTLVEVERYNAKPPARLPPDEQITRTVRTDPNGIVTVTLPEPGWWCLTAQRSGPEQERDGKHFPLRERTTMWVFVDPNPTAEPVK
jgi:cobalt/nickel transport protein